jgi:glucose/arabinose dehydrogenase
MADMHDMRRWFPILLLLLAAAGLRPEPAASAQGAGVQLPAGFTVRVFATGLATPRFLTYSPQGDLYVGQLQGNASAITILPDRDHDGSADRAIRVATDLYSPNNVSFRPAGFGTVFVAGALDRVRVYTDTRGDLSFADSATLVSGLSNATEGRHKTKTVSVGPDGRLYLSKGSFYDAPDSAEAIAGIWRYNADGSGGHKLAGGLRNAVGLAWDAVGGGLWAVDNGSDNLGRNAPGDELNLIRDGGDYGWPYCYDNRVRTPDTDAYDCSKTLAPATRLAPHAGALGMAFYTGARFPEQYWGGLFVAYHSVQYPEQRGVWFVPFRDGQPSGPPELFFRRTVSDGAVNRVIGLAVNPYDGSLMVSDDRAGTIFQIAYTGPEPIRAPPPPAPTAVPGKQQPIPAVPLDGFSRRFPETGQELDGAFLQFWFWNGGLARFGFPVSRPLLERAPDGQTYIVQYTERARLEYHPENRGGAFAVLLGRLGADLATGRSEAPFQEAAPLPGATYVAETHHNLQGPLADYWRRNGGIPVFGYPLSEVFVEVSATDGKPYRVQYFERNRLEYHPEFAGTDAEVLLGLLGVQSYAARYGK